MMLQKSTSEQAWLPEAIELLDGKNLSDLSRSEKDMFEVLKYRSRALSVSVTVEDNVISVEAE
jgi:hypothetical protein